MSYILQLDPIVSLDTVAWLIIERPDAEETERVSLAQLTALFAGVKTVNSQLPTAGNVNLTPDNISDVTSEKKFVSAVEKTLIAILQNDGDGTLFLANDGTYKTTPSGGAPVWGNLVGDITEQTDLVMLIESTAAVWGNIMGNIEDQGDLTYHVNVLINNALNAVLSVGGDGTLFLSDDGTYKVVSGGATHNHLRFRFNSSLFLDDAHLFVGPYIELNEKLSDNLSSVVYSAKIDDGSAYTAVGDIDDLLAWINANIADGMAYWVKASVTFSSAGVGELFFPTKLN